MPVADRLTRAVQGAAISWHEIGPAGFVIAAAGIFHAVHVGGQSATARCAGGADGRVGRFASTAPEDCGEHGHEVTATVFVSLGIAKADQDASDQVLRRPRAAAETTWFMCLLHGCLLTWDMEA